MDNELKPTIAAFGEVLWDVFPSGPRFGGAPANFASHAAALDADVSMVSAVGNDELGDAALHKLDAASVCRHHVAQLNSWPTGAVKVTLDASGSASYRFGADEAWDQIPWVDTLLPLASSVDMICFGTLAQRGKTSQETLKRFLSASKESTLRLLDLNLRPPYYDVDRIVESLTFANVLKVNDDELGALASIFAFGGNEEDYVKQLVDRFQLSVVAVTLGSHGGLIYREGEFDRCASRPVEVEDTVGAGDSFTAALAVGLLSKLPLSTINLAACRLAEYVCTQPGPTPKIPPDLLSALG